MHIMIIALIFSILSLASSLLFVGFLPSLVSLVMGITLFAKEEEKTIEAVRIISISAAGVILPIIMYFNTFGFGLPSKNGTDVGFYQKILSTNYSSLGIHIFDPKPVADKDVAFDDKDGKGALGKNDESSFYVNNDLSEPEKSDVIETEESTATEQPSIFESLDSIAPEEKNKGGIVSIAPSDDDMPSYGGLPVGTLLIAQYFREDDHNANPVLVLQNRSGDPCRYECRFIARDKNGEEMAVSDKTVEVVRDGAVFVFEGRFDKRDLGGSIPDAYEFSITRRKPYENDMASQVSIYTAVEGNSALLTAENKSDKKVKVDAYVLFFDKNELVDCMWMIPQNTDEVCLEPGTAANIQGDAYYRFDRVETYYTAYEAVGE